MTPESYLSKDGLNVVVSVKQRETFRIPIHNIESIVTFGYMGVSPGLMKLCSDSGVSLTFLSPTGRFIGHFQGPTQGNVLLRKAQYSLSDDVEYSTHLTQLFIAGKVRNGRNILQRHIRDNGRTDRLEYVVSVLNECKNKILNCSEKDKIRAIEGEAANFYFGVFDSLILNQKDDFKFSGRNRRPPKDEVNAMLSFVYTLLANDISAALETVGLDPYVGFFHSIRPGRPSLSLDVMEELRSYLGDRLVLSLINRRQITKNDFLKQGDEGIVMTDSGRKTILSSWQKRKKETIIHPFLQENVSIGLLPYIQALLLARYLRNGLDDYPVFCVK